MVSPNEDDMPDDMTPKPLDELFERSKMPPPPEIVVAPLLQNFWMTQQAGRSGDAVTVGKSGLSTMPLKPLDMLLEL